MITFREIPLNCTQYNDKISSIYLHTNLFTSEATQFAPNRNPLLIPIAPLNIGVQVLLWALIFMLGLFRGTKPETEAHKLRILSQSVAATFKLRAMFIKLPAHDAIIGA